MHVPLLSYCGEFGRSRSNRMGVDNGSPKFWRCWGPLPWARALLTPRNTPLTTCVTVSNLIGLCQALRVYVRRSALASSFSRALKVIGTDTDQWSTYDFLLVIHGNHRLSRPVSEINGVFGRKLQFFPPLVFNAPFPLEFFYRRWGQNVLRYVQSFRRNTVLDRRTDGQTELV